VSQALVSSYRKQSKKTAPSSTPHPSQPRLNNQHSTQIFLFGIPTFSKSLNPRRIIIITTELMKVAIASEKHEMVNGEDSER
jgi:hypothetical protein